MSTQACRKPLNEGVTITLLSRLSLLETVLDHVLDRIGSLAPAAPSTIIFPIFPPAKNAVNNTFQPAQKQPRLTFDHVLNVLALFFSRSWATVTLALHRELQRRHSAESTSDDLVSTRQQERSLRYLKQSRDLARQGARIAARTVVRAPSLPYMLHLGARNVQGWVEVLFEEIQGAGHVVSAEMGASLNQ